MKPLGRRGLVAGAGCAVAGALAGGGALAAVVLGGGGSGAVPGRPAPASPALVPAHAVVQATTANWAGRLVTPGAGDPALTESVMRVAVPAVSCPAHQEPGQTWMLSIWAGLGGWRGDTLYQAGIEVTCAPGNPVPAYDGFYEAVRTGSSPVVDVVPHTVLTPLATHSITAGDVVQARVTVTGRTARFAVSDVPAGAGTGRSGWAETVPVALPGPAAAPSAAGCIVERPSITDAATGTETLASLPDFSPVFADPEDRCSAADAAGHLGDVGDPAGRWPETVVAMSPDGAGGTARTGTGEHGRPLAVTWEPGR